MGKNLVIVESPAKAKTINKILGKDFIVTSCMGHVRDLPKSKLGVDVDKGFEPKYVVAKTRKKVVDELKKASKGCEMIYLAPDPDREGEAIAWHLKEILSSKDNAPAFARVQYNEITPSAVKKAFSQSGEIDMNRVHAQQARRILDRIVGYKVSPILWRHIRRGLSAGRVQSVALRLLCEREKQIEEFVPQEYWLLDAVVRKLVVPLDPFTVHLSRVDGKKADIKSSEQANRIKSDVASRSLKVLGIEVKDTQKKAPPPFMTSTLQQAASSRHGFSPKRTMTLAQKLYEGVNLGSGPEGLITYMRTDSLSIARDAITSCRDYIAGSVGDEYLPAKPNFFKSKGSAQQAHEAIRPTDVSRTPEKMSSFMDASMQKLYRLIWTRFVASQMKPALIEKRTVTVEAVAPSPEDHEYLFDAGTSTVKFPGFMKIAGKTDDLADGKVPNLPELSEREPLECIDWKMERKETQPSPRYSEASLVKALEKNGVGRPSTYAQTISTLHSRKYVTIEKRTLFPTDLGRQVSDLLVANLNDLFAVGFTAQMEKSLDKVEEGEESWDNMLSEFYGMFQEWLSHVQMPVADKGIVRQALDALEKVQEWAPSAKAGKRIYDDKAFVESIRQQLDEGEKGVSKRQLDTLMKIGWKYKDQAPDIVGVADKSGHLKSLEARGSQKPEQLTLRKLDILEKVELDEKTSSFVASLRQRVDSKRALSEAQKAALDRTLVGHAEKVPDFDRIKAELGLTDTDVAARKESQDLIKRLSGVTQWNEPVKRGKRVFDDKKFYESLESQLKERGILSDRQRAALKKMVKRYEKNPEKDKTQSVKPDKKEEKPSVS